MQVLSLQNAKEILTRARENTTELLEEDEYILADQDNFDHEEKTNSFTDNSSWEKDLTENEAEERRANDETEADESRRGIKYGRKKDLQSGRLLPWFDPAYDANKMPTKKDMEKLSQQQLEWAYRDAKACREFYNDQRSLVPHGEQLEAAITKIYEFIAQIDERTAFWWLRQQATQAQRNVAASMTTLRINVSRAKGAKDGNAQLDAQLQIEAAAKQLSASYCICFAVDRIWSNHGPEDGIAIFDDNWMPTILNRMLGFGNQESTKSIVDNALAGLDLNGLKLNLDL